MVLSRFFCKTGVQQPFNLRLMMVRKVKRVLSNSYLTTILQVNSRNWNLLVKERVIANSHGISMEITKVMRIW